MVCSLLLLYSGTYDIFVKFDDGEKLVGSYDNKGSFGELALMYNMPRSATIIATSEGSLWAMVSLTARTLHECSVSVVRSKFTTCC